MQGRAEGPRGPGRVQVPPLEPRHLRASGALGEGPTLALHSLPLPPLPGVHSQGPHNLNGRIRRTNHR